MNEREPMEPSLDVRVDPGSRTVRLAGELDMASVDRLLGAVLPLAERGGDLLVELRDLEFMDSSGLGGLFRVAASLRGGDRLQLLEPRPPVRRVLELVGGCGMHPGIVVLDRPA